MWENFLKDMRSDSPPAVIPDIFIPPTQSGNAGVTGGRNENSGMTRGGILSRPPRHLHT